MSLASCVRRCVFQSEDCSRGLRVLLLKSIIKDVYCVQESGTRSFILVAATRDSKRAKEAKFWRDHGQEDGKQRRQS